jgi:hypothetical protein
MLQVLFIPITESLLFFFCRFGASLKGYFRHNNCNNMQAVICALTGYSAVVILAYGNQQFIKPFKTAVHSLTTLKGRAIRKNQIKTDLVGGICFIVHRQLFI